MQQQQDAIELIDVVDENDKVIDVLPREVVHKKGLCFRAVCGFLKNKAGNLWIPRRTAHKTIYPLALDMSVAGHVMAGESYEHAFFRELKEELDIDRNDCNITTLGYVGPHHGLVAFYQVFEILSDVAPNYNQEDFCEYFWLSPPRVIDRIKKGEKSKSDLSKLIQYFYL